MLILPNAAYVASLSKDKVIFAGDFRQIPPIISEKKSEIVQSRTNFRKKSKKFCSSYKPVQNASKDMWYNK